MIHRFYVLCYCQKFNRTDGVTSAGVIPGIMSVTDWFGATPNTDDLQQTIRTRKSGQDTRFCVGINMASYDYGKIEVVNYVYQHFAPGSSCLDVGACDGKWHDLLGHYLIMDAVEVWAPNIREHRLKDKYRRVWECDAYDFRYDRYDLIIFGDVIEHMTVERAQRVLEYAKGKCKDMIIGVPFNYPQDAIYGNPYEEHIQPDLTDKVFGERYPGFTMLCQPRGDYAYYHMGDADG